MSKVKISDIKSGSENVKELFKRNIERRELRWLEKQKYTNSELLEILSLSEKIEVHESKQEFYQVLILSQTGPFSQEVFRSYIKYLVNPNALSHLVLKTKELDEKDKLQFINISIFSMAWFMPNFYMNERCKNVGIDIMKSPYNIKLAKAVVKFKTKFEQCVFPTLYRKFMFTVLDTMNEDELFDWYEDVVSITNEKNALCFFQSYQKATEKMIESFYKKTHFNELALHNNCPNNIKMEVFEKTKNNRYLPKEVNDVFIF